MTRHLKYTVIALGAVCIFLNSCTQMTKESGIPAAFEVHARLKPAQEMTGTKAGLMEEQDKWSYRTFTLDDVLGLYASTTNGTTYTNAPMMFSEETAADGSSVYKFLPLGDANFDPAAIRASSVFMYFPYSEFMSDEQGMPLRTKKQPYSTTAAPDGPWRCIDFLTTASIDASDIRNGILICDFVHSFSELIIMRGDGFKEPKAPAGADPKEIKVFLKRPVTHVKVEYTKDQATLSFVNDDGYKPDENEASFDARAWTAWEGDNYGITEKDPEGTPASYVILPTSGTDEVNAGQRIQVDYIQLYDDEGNLQTVKNLHLDGTGNSLSSGWRYPMVIRMEELVPTVFPYTIEEWGEKTITNQRNRGIGADTFQAWLEAYKLFITDNRLDKHDDVLNRFGDKITSNDRSYWHFYIFDSIDLSRFASGDCVIPELQDVLDGMSSPMRNPVTISGLSIPFIGKMTGPADSLLNLTFDHPEVIGTGPVGCLVKTLEGGGIDNCTVTQGVVTAKQGAAGMFCGTAAGGSVTNSKASGVVIASESDPDPTAVYLIGTQSGGFHATGNNSSVIFNSTNP